MAFEDLEENWTDACIALANLMGLLGGHAAKVRWHRHLCLSMVLHRAFSNHILTLRIAFRESRTTATIRAVQKAILSFPPEQSNESSGWCGGTAHVGFSHHTHVDADVIRVHMKAWYKRSPM